MKMPRIFHFAIRLFAAFRFWHPPKPAKKNDEKARPTNVPRSRKTEIRRKSNCCAGLPPYKEGIVRFARPLTTWCSG
jgi:hypothetical protein